MRRHVARPAPPVPAPIRDRPPAHTAGLAGRPGPLGRGRDLPRLQRTYGNRHVQRLVRAGVPRLTVRPPGDRHEREADEVAGRVAEGGHTPVPAPIRRVGGTGGVAAHPFVEWAIEGTRGSGQPLPDALRRPFEQRLGADLGDVRLHTDAAADGLSRLLQARAFTTGGDIYFRRGEYDPATTTGRRMLAHELTHTVQQTGIDGAPAPSASTPIQRIWTHEGVPLTDPQLKGLIVALLPITRPDKQGALKNLIGLGRDDEEHHDVQLELLDKYGYKGVDLDNIFDDGSKKRKKVDSNESIGGSKKQKKVDPEKIPDVPNKQGEAFSAFTRSLSDRAAKPQRKASPPAAVRNLGAYWPAASLNEVLGIYGKDVVTAVLQATTLQDLKDVAEKIQVNVATMDERQPGYRNSLRKGKPSLFWKATNPTNERLGELASYEATGTIGELLDLTRLRRRHSAEDPRRTWFIRHEGGSGAAGPDVIIIKQIPSEQDPTSYTWRIVCHEVKLSLLEGGWTYGYGDGDESGFPSIYRANYDSKNQRIWPRTMSAEESLWSAGSQAEPVLELYLANVITADREIPRDVRSEVAGALRKQAKTLRHPKTLQHPEGQKLSPGVRNDDQIIHIDLDEFVDIEWKFTSFGRSELENTTVRTSNVSDIINQSSYDDALQVWFDYMDRPDQSEEGSAGSLVHSPEPRIIATPSATLPKVPKIPLLTNNNVPPSKPRETEPPRQPINNPWKAQTQKAEQAITAVNGKKTTTVAEVRNDFVERTGRSPDRVKYTKFLEEAYDKYGSQPYNLFGQELKHRMLEEALKKFPTLSEWIEED